MEDEMNAVTIKLSEYRFGRIVLHLWTAMRVPSHYAFHREGIVREFRGMLHHA
jgi:hypothetical protein